jgi:hypothetical protein
MLHVKTLGLLFFCLSINLVASGQYKLNFGLAKHQSNDLLPKSKADVVWPTQKPKSKQPTKLVGAQDGAFILSNGWRLLDATSVTAAGANIFDSNYSADDWFNATVPGTVLTTLVDRGVYPDPYFGLNNLVIPDSLSRMDWWYRIPFDLPKESLKKQVWLIFNGINYKADIWLNGKLLGKITGAFKQGEFNATQFVNASKENILAVHIFPPPNPGIPHEESSRTGQGPNGGSLCLDGPTFISSEGWDWIPGIRDRNIGIWQDVRIRFTNDAKLGDTHVITDLPLPSLNTADIIINAQVINTTDKEVVSTVEGKIDNIIVSQLVKLGAKEKTTVTFSPEKFPKLKFQKPKLWWPNGYGSPALYKLELTIKDNTGVISDQKSLTFGVRELSYEMSVDLPNEKNKRIEFNPTQELKNGKHLFDNVHRREAISEVYVPQLRADADPKLLNAIQDDGMAPYLVFKVNGKRIFCKGGNWGMDDGMKRVSREHLEPYIKLHKEANYTMLRNWTAESTEEDFYQLCDEYGLLVWNDFWLSTEGFNVEPLDQELTIENAKEVIKRFRNHPSVAVWCPRNEGYAPVGLEDAFAELVAKEDGTRLYQGNSRYMNLRPSGPWHYFKNQKDYFNHNAKGFTTEIGTFSVPTATTIKKFLAPEDQWPINDVWYYHDFHKEHAQKDYLKAIDSLYGTAKDLDDFSRKAQFVNYNSHRTIFEAWNSKLWKDGSGVLLWMTHPAWPSMIWQTYSWDYETHGSYFGSKKACEPIHIQMNLHDDKVVAINTSLNDLPNTKCTLTIYDLNGATLSSKEQILKAFPANRLTEVFTSDAGKVLPPTYLVRLTLSNDKGVILSLNDYLKTSGDNFVALNELPSPKLSGQLNTAAKRNDSKLLFKIKNTGTSTAVGIKLSLIDKKTNAQVLPAYFSDGYFNLLPNETREITVEAKDLTPGQFQVLAESYNGPAKFDL